MGRRKRVLPGAYEGLKYERTEVSGRQASAGAVRDAETSGGEDGAVFSVGCGTLARRQGEGILRAEEIRALGLRKDAWRQWPPSIWIWQSFIVFL